MSVPEWQGPRVMAIRAQMQTLLPAPCGVCKQPVKPGQKWVVGHIKPRWEYPELTWDPSNWRHEHASCSARTGQSEVRRKAFAEGYRAAGGQRRPEGGSDGSSDGFFRGGGPSEPPPFSAYNPEHPQDSPEQADNLPVFDPDTIRDTPWLQDLWPVPADASWPTVMSPPHPEAVGSYGVEAEEWARKELGVELRWWQKLAIRRQLEHDANGELCWQNILESTPRRAGKSVRLRVMALWRLDHADLFGEQQLVLHTGKDIPIVKEIHRAAWRWAEDVKLWHIKRANGHEEIETPEGDRWMVRSTEGVYGYDVTLGMVDEAWGVEARVVDDGLEPALLERKQPQMLLTSTAHRRATSLMKGRLNAAMANLDSDTNTLVLLWCALPSDDFASEEAWRRASPHWTEQRRKMIASKLERALAGEADPDADDPDPLEAFKGQYLNVWRFKAPRHAPGQPVISENGWTSLKTDPPTGVPEATAIEGWFGQGISVCHAYRQPDGRVLVSTTSHVDAASAAREAAAKKAPTLLVGKSLTNDPAFHNMLITAKGGTSKASVQDVKRLLDEGLLLHDGSQVLTGQITSLRTVPATEGIRIRSTGRLDAVKACTWAAEAARMVDDEPMIYL